MYSVELLTADGPVPVAVVDADEETLEAAVRAFANRDSVEMSVVGHTSFGSILNGSVNSDLISSLRSAGLNADGPARMVLRNTVLDGTVRVDGLSVISAEKSYSLNFQRTCPNCELPIPSEFKGLPPRDANGRWCKGAGCTGTNARGETRNQVSGEVEPQLQRVSTSEGDAAREALGAQLAEHPGSSDERAAILDSMSTTGPGSTVAEHDALPGNAYTAERTAMHDEIVSSFLDDPAIVADGQAVMIGGPPGAGKGSILNNNAAVGHPGTKTGASHVDSAGFVHIDPDGVKQELLDRGMVRRVPGMSDGEHAALIHEESSHITARIFAEAQARNQNIVLDKTMSSAPRGELEGLRANNYSVKGVFVSVPVDESVGSAMERWRTGGRFVPPKYIESSRLPDGSTKNLRAFESVTGGFDSWFIVDNTGIWPDRNPRGTVLSQGSGLGRFASSSITVFRAYTRDQAGRFAPGNASANAQIVTDGQRVKVSPDGAVPLIEDLGNRPGSSDLTKVSIAGHPNLYGEVAENNITRVEMPQIPSDRLDGFQSHLNGRGISTSLETVDPADLRATQNELDGRKVGKMITSIRSGRMSTEDKPLWVSSDNKILDGHHRWAAEAAMSVGEQPRQMTVVRVDAPMSTLLPIAKSFALDEGIDSKRHGMSLMQSFAMTGKPVSFAVPRAGDGKWCKGAACTSGDHSSPGQKAAHTKRMKKAEAEAVLQAEVNPVSGQMPASAAEFAAMEKVGGPLGSNGGGWYRDESGQKYLVKPAPSEAHAHNELASQMLYRHLGVPVDDTAVFEDNGQHFIAKKAIQGPDGQLGQIVGQGGMTPELQLQARQGFHADALASSWDAYGMNGDNVLTQGGTLYRIDVGGSGQFRAMGTDKPSFAPGKSWVEPDTLRTGRQGRSLYGNMSDSDAATSLRQLQGFNVDAFDSQLSAAGINDSVRTRMVDTIRYRVEVELPDILDRLG